MKRILWWGAGAFLVLAMIACGAGQEPVKKPNVNQSAPATPIQAGKYLAGVDIRAGNWSIHANESDCSWERDTVDWSNGERIKHDKSDVKEGTEQTIHISALWQLVIKGGCIASYVP